MTRAELVGWDHPDVAGLRAAQQAEIAALYGAPDPLWDMTSDGVLAAVLLRDDDGTPVACGALRDAAELGPGTGELKRMFVVPARRGGGLSRRVLDELEAAAVAHGLTRLVLETGPLQAAAIGLYLAAGYVPTDRFPPYEDDQTSRAFVKALTPPTAAPDTPPTSAAAGAPPVVAVSPPAASASASTSRSIVPLVVDGSGYRRRVEVSTTAGAGEDASEGDGEGAGGAGGLAVERVGWGDPVAVALRRLMAETLRGFYGPTGWFADDETAAAADRAEAPRALVVLVVRDGADPVGTVTLSAAPQGRPAGWGELERLLVLPAARGRGVARRMLREVEAEARARGMSTVTLSTGYRQYPAMRLYLSSGYRIVAPAGDDWPRQGRLFWFAKDL